MVSTPTAIEQAKMLMGGLGARVGDRIPIEQGGRTVGMSIDELLRKHAELYALMTRNRSGYDLAFAEWGWLMLQVKRHLGHGNFSPFLKSVNVHEKTAQRAMGVAGECVMEGRFCPEMVAGVLARRRERRRETTNAGGGGELSTTNPTPVSVLGSAGLGRMGGESAAHGRAPVVSGFDPDDVDCPVTAGVLLAGIEHCRGLKPRFSEKDMVDAARLGVEVPEDVRPEGEGTKASEAPRQQAEKGSASMPRSLDASMPSRVTQLTLDADYAIAEQMRVVARMVEGGCLHGDQRERLLALLGEIEQTNQTSTNLTSVDAARD